MLDDGDRDFEETWYLAVTDISMDFSRRRTNVDTAQLHRGHKWSSGGSTGLV